MDLLNADSAFETLRVLLAGSYMYADLAVHALPSTFSHLYTLDGTLLSISSVFLQILCISIVM